MKKTFLLLSVVLSCSFLLSTQSCRKVQDLRLVLENGKEDLGQCSIQKMTQQIGSFPGYVEQFFAYNDKGEPISVTFAPGFATPFNIQWQLYYDGKARLSQFITAHTDGTFANWQVYFYDDKGRITGDSSYQSGQLLNRGTAVYRAFYKLTYDNLNRIIKETDGTTYTVEYVYNAQGNLTSRRVDDNGSVSVQDFQGYTKQYNVLLTNKIWRFLARNYSVNSLGEPFTVNDAGLATTYRNNAGSDIGLFFFGLYVNVELLIT
jgi:YD repeat-containing protein